MATDLLPLGGQTLQLLPERCVFWREAGILILADLHLGKAAHLRHHGIPIPEGHTADDLARLTQVIHRTGARELVICGDFFHAPTAQSSAIIGLVETWRAAHPGVVVSLVIGNHDRGRALPPPGCGIPAVGVRCHRAPFHFVHDPADVLPDGIHFAGHLHPLAVLPGSRSLKAPCFWWQAASRTLILPAFGTLTAGVAVHPAPGDTLHAVFNDAILPVPGHLYHRKTG